MNGINFGNYHSWKDFELLLVSKEIGSSKVKTKEVEVDGSSVILDYTEAFGEVKYGQRPLVFNFKTIVPQSQFDKVYSKVLDALHGQRMDISLDSEPDYYYSGRLSVSSFTNEKNVGIISVECTCEPWKYKVEETVVAQSVNGSATIVLTNRRKKVVPTITTDAEMTIAFDGYTGTYSASTFIIPELELSQGENTVTVTGTGNISFSYREGGL